MATTVRLASGGSNGGGDPPREPPDEQVRAPTTLRTPLVSAASKGPDPGAAESAKSPNDGPSPAAPSQRESGTVRLESGTEEAPTVALAAPKGGRPQCPECGERFSRGSRFCAFDGSRLVEAPEEACSDPLIGKSLGGKYTVLRPIGEGGMGTIYEVRHNALDRKFALKILRPEIAQNGEHIQRFLQEAKAATAIGHPNIVSVSDFGEHTLRGRTVPFIVMELLRGGSLADLLKVKRTLPAERCADIIAKCADALAAAHSAGVIHRDLKPDNIFLAGENGEDVKVLDFGVAKMQGATRLTKVGMVFGTPHYMSPEQARGQTIDHRADIYALGVILYECLAGHVPFEADTEMGVLTKQIFANPEPIERIMPDPRALGALGSIVMRCLAKEPNARYASMDELALALRKAKSNPVGAAADALGPDPGHKPPGLRLGEGMPVPGPSAPQVEPAPRKASQVLPYVIAGAALIALLIVSARLFWSPQNPASSPSTSAALAASAAPSATGTASAQAPSAEKTAAPASKAANSAAPTAASGQQAAAPGPTASTTSAAPTSASPGGGPGPKSTNPTGVVDPWSRPTKKPAAPRTDVVDPWANKN